MDYRWFNHYSTISISIALDQTRFFTIQSNTRTTKTLSNILMKKLSPPIKKSKEYISNKEMQRHFMKLGHNLQLISSYRGNCNLEDCKTGESFYDRCIIRHYMCANCHVNNYKIGVIDCPNSGLYGFSNIDQILYDEFDIDYGDPSQKLYSDMLFESYDRSCGEVISIYDCIKALRAFE